MSKLKQHEKDELAGQISGRYQKSYDFQQIYFNRYIEYYKLYRGILDSGQQNYNGRARLFVPMTYSTIETIMPRLVGAKPKIEATPREHSDINNSIAVTNLLNYQWDEMDMHSKLKLWVKQGLLYGVGMGKLIWNKNKPEFDLVDLFDFYMDPIASDIQSAKYVIHRIERTLEQVKKNKAYDVPKELEEEVMEETYKIRRDAVIGVTRHARNNNGVEIFEYWGDWEIDGEVQPALITLANRRYILRIEKNPYTHKQKPFVAFHDTQIPNEFWSIGEIEPIRKLQYELNDTRNQRMDNVSLILNRLWLVNKNADVDEAELVSQAGQIIHAQDISEKGIRDLQTPDVTTSSYNEETLIKDDAKTASGVNDFISGQAGSGISGSSIGNETARGIMLLQEAGNARFRYKLDNLEDSLKKLGEQLIALNQQFITKAQLIRIIGEKGLQWVDVTPEEIKGQFDLQVEAGSTQPMNKSVRRAEARELLATVAPFAQLGVNLEFFIKHLLETYDLTNIDEAFNQQNQIMQSGAQAGVTTPGEQFGGQSGAVLGGDTGNRPNNELKGLGNLA